MSPLQMTAVLLLSLTASAGHAEDPRNNLPLKIFKEDIAPLYRPSFGEEPIRALIAREVENARLNPAWAGQPIELFEDDAGNILVRLPGTGRFAHSTTYTALQAHLDMVPATSRRDATAKEVLAHGVDLVQTGSWMHSRGYATTIGADNGLGVAAMIAFMRDPTLEHEPLELLFTVAEEQGMVGAKNLGLTLKSKRLINLDNEDYGQIGHGCLGGRRVGVKAQLPTVALPAGYTAMRATITKLPFGHSGAQIHEPRANAITFGAELLNRLMAFEPDVKLVSARSAAKDSLNIIPGHIELNIATQRPAEVLMMLRDLVRGMKDEVPGAQSAKLLVKRPDVAPTRALGVVAAGSLAAILAEMPNGVHRHDPEFPNGVKTSSSVGYLNLSDAGQFELAYMARSFEQPDIDAVDRGLRAYLMLNGPLTETALAEMISQSPPWLGAKDSELIRAALRADPDQVLVLVAGGLEAALFGVPDTIAIGPTIRNPHSPEETFDVDTVPKFFALLRRILIESGGCESSLVSTH